MFVSHPQYQGLSKHALPQLQSVQVGVCCEVWGVIVGKFVRVTMVHRNLGHPQNTGLARLFKEAGAEQHIIQAVNSHQWDFCIGEVLNNIAYQRLQR